MRRPVLFLAVTVAVLSYGSTASEGAWNTPKLGFATCHDGVLALETATMIRFTVSCDVPRGGARPAFGILRWKGRSSSAARIRGFTEHPRASGPGRSKPSGECHRKTSRQLGCSFIAAGDAALTGSITVRRGTACEIPITIYQRILHCGPERREACFSKDSVYRGLWEDVPSGCP